MKTLAKAGLATALALSLVVSGCSAAWIQVAIDDVPVVLQIVTSIIGIVQAAQGSEDPAVVNAANAAAAEAKADLQQLQLLVDDYKTAAAADKPGLVGKIDAALATAQKDLAGILVAFHVKNQNLQLTIATSVGLALSTLAAIEALIPAQTAQVSAKAVAKPPKPAELKKQFNTVVRNNGYAQFSIK